MVSLLYYGYLSFWMIQAFFPGEMPEGNFVVPERRDTLTEQGSYGDVPLKTGEVLISEILYEAIPSDAEYLEIYNNSNRYIDLSKLQLARRNSSGDIFAMKEITDSCFWFAPYSLVWICSRLEEIMSRYAYHCRDNCVVVPTKLSYSDGGGTVLVLYDKRVILDELVYGRFLHHSMVKERKGVALERVAFDCNTNSREAWTSAAGSKAEGYGSPGMPNRALKSQEAETMEEGFKRWPEVFTPNGDGWEDELKITVKERNKKFSFKLVVYNARGEVVKVITEGSPVSEEGTFSWNGSDQKGMLVPAGIYILYGEMTSEDGVHRVFRKTCVVSRE